MKFKILGIIALIAPLSVLANPFHKIFTAHGLVTEYSEWKASPYHPEHYLPRVIKKLKTEQEIQNFCIQLDNVNKENYVVLLASLISIGPYKVSCINGFITKAKAYLDLKKERLTWNFETLHNFSQPHFDNPVETLGPSKEIFLDTTDGPVLVRGDAEDKEIIITFDDGPHSTLTLELLEVLKNENLQVQFFSQGVNIQKNPVIYNHIHNDGHSIGNHSWSHPNMKKISYSKSVRQIEKTFDEMYNQLGYYQAFFRFPYGNRTSKLKRYLKSHHIASFLWNMDTRDWSKKHRDPEVLLEYSLQQVLKFKKGIILFHDVQPQTIAMMPAFLRRLKAMRYTPLIYRSDSLTR